MYDCHHPLALYFQFSFSFEDCCDNMVETNKQRSDWTRVEEDSRTAIQLDSNCVKVNFLFSAVYKCVMSFQVCYTRSEFVHLIY